LTEAEILGPTVRRRIRGVQEKGAPVAELRAEGGKMRLVDRWIGRATPDPRASHAI
jgi:hypothetical protein